MTRGKRLECPNITIVRATEPKFKTRDEAWQVVGPILARILAQTISVEKQEQKGETHRQWRSKARKKH